MKKILSFIESPPQKNPHTKANTWEKEREITVVSNEKKLQVLKNKIATSPINYSLGLILIVT